MGDLNGLREPQSTDTAAHSVDSSSDSSARAAVRLKDYEIKGVIGEGGIGVVYRARHLVSGNPVAIKVLHDSCGRQKDLVEKLFVEAKAASRIHHPNISDVTDLGTAADGTVFLATGYLDGESLEDRLRRVHRLPIFEAINIVRQVAHGLGAAHELGIVHRALKPSNIFLCSREGHRRIVRRTKETGMRFAIVPEKSFDLVKLLDFGAAKFIDFDVHAQTPAEVVCRKPYYLSPEQAQGRPTDQRCDIYALGAVFYQMVTGAVPVSGETVPAIVSALAAGSIIVPSRRAPEAGASLRIDSLILKCLSRNPALRFASTAELCTALDDCLGDCAYLRDAHRLPGIQYSDIDLSQASLEARQNAASAGPAAQEPPAEPIAKATKVVPKTASRASRRAEPSAPQKTEAKLEVRVDRQFQASSEKRAPTKGAQNGTQKDAQNGAQKDAPKAIVVAEAPAQAEAPVAATPAIVATPAPEKRKRLPARWLIGIGGIVLVGLAVAFWLERHETSPTAQPAATIASPAPTPAAPERPAAIAPSAAPVAPVAPVAPTPSAPAPSAAAPVAAVPAVPAAEPAVAAPEPARAPAVRAAPPEGRKTTPAAKAKAASSASHRGRHKKEHGAVAVSSEVSDEAPSPAAEPAATAEEAAKPETEPEATTDALAPSEPEASERPKGSSSSVEERMREAQRASRKGHHKVAIRKARAVLAGEPKSGQVMQAYQIIATSSCALGKVVAAREAASHLDKRAHTAVRAACKKDGVAIE